MAITQPSSTSPILLGLTNGAVPLNPAAGVGVAAAGGTQGGGFHFHLNGSLQAYQEARAGAEAGTVLPPVGEGLPDTPVVDVEQASQGDGTVHEQSSSDGAGDSALIDVLDTPPVDMPGVPSESINETGAQGQPILEDNEPAIVQQTDRAQPASEEVLQRVKPLRPDAARVERVVETVSGEPSGQTAQERQTVQTVARVEAAVAEVGSEQAGRQQLVQQPVAAPVEPAQAAPAEAVTVVDETAAPTPVQPGRDERSGQQVAARSQNEVAAHERATPAQPAQPFPGEGKPAQPATPAVPSSRDRSRLAGEAVVTAADVEATVNTRAAAAEVETRVGVDAGGQQMPFDGQSQLTGAAVGGDLPISDLQASERVVIPVEPSADSDSEPLVLNLQLQNANAQASTQSVGSAQSDSVQEAAPASSTAVRQGPDNTGGRTVSAESVAARAEQVSQGSSGGMSGGEEGDQQSSQRQDSQQAQAVVGRVQAGGAAGVAQPQQAFSLPQQQLPTGWGRAIGERAIMMAQHGPRTAQIQLDPPELGAMQIRIHMSAGDQVSVSFTSPNPMVREALEQQMPRLREMFADQGLNLQDSSVADQSPQQQSGQRDDARHGQNGGRYGGGDAAREESMALHSVKVGLVDYYA